MSAVDDDDAAGHEARGVGGEQQQGAVQVLRLAQAAAWIEDAVRHRFGSDGLARGGPPSGEEAASPFRAIGRRAAALSAARDRAISASPA